MRVISAFCRAREGTFLEGQGVSTQDSVKRVKEEASRISVALPCLALEEAVEVSLVQSAASGQPEVTDSTQRLKAPQILARIATFLPAWSQGIQWSVRARIRELFTVKEESPERKTLAQPRAFASRERLATSKFGRAEPGLLAMADWRGWLALGAC